jgi:hypothetical protein
VPLFVTKDSCSDRRFGGSDAVGRFYGGKAMSVSTIGRARNAIGRAGRSMEQAGDIGRVQVTVIEYQRQLDD